MIPSSSSAPPPAPDAAAIGSSSSIRTESGMESTGLDWAEDTCVSVLEGGGLGMRDWGRGLGMRLGRTGYETGEDWV